MEQFCKVNGVEYPAQSFVGKLKDASWDDRFTKVITLQMTYAQALEIFTDGVAWSIVNRWTDEETGEPMMEEFDNSEFNIPGEITDFRNGFISIKLGKETDLEEAYELLYGGE